MKEEYNSRQRKIYDDYKAYSTESLYEILNKSDKYIPEVIEVINDILVERKVMLSHEDCVAPDNQDSTNPEVVENEQEIFFNEMKKDDESLIKSFISKLSEKSNSELSDIITRYIEYQLETVKAALILSVDRGIIPYDLKELLSEQIDTNFAAHARGVRRFKWESNNAFIKYLSVYQDDEIYQIIEDPKGIVIDVYHAVLVTAKERELISENDFTGFYKDAKLAIRTEREIESAEIDEYIKSDLSVEAIEDEVEIEAEKEKYWKCPVCNQLVEMEFGVCWNCQSESPQMIEHPDTEEIIKEIASKKSFSPAKAGLSVIAGGVLISVAGQFRHHHHSLFFDSDIDFISLVFGGLVVLFGIGIMIYGKFFLPKE
jgi:hypothetical protein